MPTSELRFLPVLCLLVAALGCGGDADPRAQDGTVIAEDRLGPITRPDLDRFIVSLPAGERSPGDADRTDWHASLVRRMAVERLLLDGAELTGLDADPRYLASVRPIARDAVVDEHLNRTSIARPTEDELRAHYEEHRERYRWPERRQTFHVFRRWPSDGDRQRLATELEALRQQALGGVPFSHLAREHSESETRHRDGLLGSVVRGQFPAAFDEVVFALEEGVPSPVVETGEGAHVFYVAQVHEARVLELEEVRAVVSDEILTARRREHLAAVAAELELPDERFVPDREAVARIFAHGNGADLVLRLGDFRLTAAELLALAGDRQPGHGSIPTIEHFFEQLEEVRDREVVYQDRQSQGLTDPLPDAAQRSMRDELVAFVARERMASRLGRDADRVRRHYEGNALRFATPVRVDLTFLALPLGDAPAARMAELERSREPLDRGEETLEDLAAQYGGQITDRDGLTAAQLGPYGMVGLRSAMQLAPAEHSPPFQGPGGLTVLRVDARRDPEPQPLAAVWDRVVADYLDNYAAELFDELSEELLEEAGFRLYRDRLAEAEPAGAS